MTLLTPLRTEWARLLTKELSHVKLSLATLSPQLFLSNAAQLAVLQE